MNTDLIRFVDSISRDKSIDKESVFTDLEAAMISAARKAYGEETEVAVRIDRLTGDVEATMSGQPIDMKMLGRIAAQTAKQVMIQRIREDERNSIFEEFSQRVGTVVTGTVTRYEGGGLTINLGRVEAFLPRSEQIPGQTHHPGERIRGMILDVREEPNQVRIVLTQTHPDYIRKLFELEVPEVAERIIEVRALAREAGYRTKIAVSSIDSKVDAVGACVGVRGSRIRNIVDELGGEKIDIVRWNESSQVLIGNALKPAEIKETFLCFELGRATVVVGDDQLSLAIGKRGQNVRLAARLTGWDIDILTPSEYDRHVDDMERVLKGIAGVEDVMLDKLLALGVISLSDVGEIGVEPLVKDVSMSEELAAKVVEVAAVEAPRLAAEFEAAKKAKAEEDARRRAEEASRAAEVAVVDPMVADSMLDEAVTVSAEVSVASTTSDEEATPAADAIGETQAG
ncbi:MAG: transcription termination factor NusA [Planctomycetota bacterium]